MDLADLLKHTVNVGYDAVAKATGVVGSGIGYVRQVIGQLALFGSTESLGASAGAPADEKHYFLVPFRATESGYTLYSMRCLPSAVPPINDLPKRRVFHLPGEAAAATVEHLLREEARTEIAERTPDPQALGRRLIGLADQIDRLDHKVFGGVLTVGALVALVNPIAGAALAAKALIPSMGILLSKFGLKYAGDSLNERSLRKRLKAAEKQVVAQFRGSATQSLVNPLLQHLDRALSTCVEEFDPLFEARFAELDFGVADRERYMQLTCRAITNVYESVLADPAAAGQPALDPEDQRWLRILAQRARA